MTRGGAPVVVVGAGLAGLCTALACAPRPVLLVSTSVDGVGTSSVLAQGGIAAALAPDDSCDAHAADTLDAGALRNDRIRVAQLVRAAPWAVAWLAAQGVGFDGDEDGLALGREGGHRCSRIVHAGGDATGARVMAALARRVIADTRIERLERVHADALLLRGRRIAGVRLVDDGGRSTLVETDTVVLATGGIGGLFARSTNPPTHRGSGIALALAAGTRLRDMEFVQFHPTALDIAGDASQLPLVTEALRGAGAVLRDSCGRPVMAGVDPRGDLAPRDIVARRLWQLRDLGGAWLDAAALDRGVLARFPTVLAACRQYGVDPLRAPIPVTPAAHFHMGGIAVNGFGATSLSGLYAVGEVACSGVHGANRLASNSLLECVVTGDRLGRVLAQWSPTGPGRGAFEFCESGAPLPPEHLHVLRGTMWDAAGPVRATARLARALDELHALGDAAADVRVAIAIVRAAATNRRSVGAHWLDETAAAERRVGLSA